MSQHLAIARLPLKHTEQLPTVLRLAIGCIAHIYLDPREAPISSSAIAEKQCSNPSLCVTRQQLPLSATYAFMDFKSQGQTIDHIVIDIGKMSNFAFCGRDSICLLQDFKDYLFTHHPSEYLWVEDEHIEDLSKKTELNFNVKEDDSTMLV
ncbi:hypothetical protein BDR06DRAFT_969119 [Suillus hirtellus]|nr:hypothetical protein BDR06DRAFT_969119 [Suillus hirtellus]